MHGRLLKFLLYFHIEELKLLIGLGNSTIQQKVRPTVKTSTCCEIIPRGPALSCHSGERARCWGLKHQFYGLWWGFFMTSL